MIAKIAKTVGKQLGCTLVAFAIGVTLGTLLAGGSISEISPFFGIAAVLLSLLAGADAALLVLREERVQQRRERAADRLRCHVMVLVAAAGIGWLTGFHGFAWAALFVAGAYFLIDGVVWLHGSVSAWTKISEN